MLCVSESRPDFLTNSFDILTNTYDFPMDSYDFLTNSYDFPEFNVPKSVPEDFLDVPKAVPEDFLNVKTVFWLKTGSNPHGFGRE